eukprot:TRINITY_DN6364_c0_g1_i1.p1 TRINITY_DN6364_c0_g1~~TRINITY_DN6364_c0_g1_i1.p1  ORF type:complete len:163 (-),score=32.19 TRINITY_DN6364_c0_g1_i1:65-520(-)
MRKVMFGKYLINRSQVFYRTKHSYALVNLMPVLPGHVLIVTNKPVARFTELEQDEATDLFTCAHIVGKVVEKHHKADSLSIVIQDGKAAGQTVSQVHIHVIPRFFNDIPENDALYKQLEVEPVRTPRTEEDMAKEASQLRELLGWKDTEDQ